MYHYQLVRCFHPSGLGASLRRRDFIKALAGSAAAALPLAAQAQQSTLPVVGFLNSGSPHAYRHLAVGFQQGLEDTGYVEGQNVVIEYCWANGQYDPLTEMVADLIRRPVNVIVAATTPAALAAEASKTTVPIIFDTAGDPVRLGLVASLNHPGRNITGISQVSSELVSKRAPVRCKWPLSGVKRTSGCAAHISAFDRKRTLKPGTLT